MEDFTRCDDVSHDCGDRSLQTLQRYQEDHDQGSLHKSSWTTTHIIPISSLLSCKESVQNDRYGEEDNGMDPYFPDVKDDDRLRHSHRRKVSCGFPVTPSSEYPGSSMAAQYKRQCRDPKDHSDESTPLTPFFSATSKIAIDSAVNDPVDDTMDDTRLIYTPKPVRISQSSTPVWFTHYSSASSSATSTPAASRRGSYATSPRTFMLQGFLARHSNGHIMYPKPIKCSAECSDSYSSSESGAESSSVSQTSEDDEEFDERLLLLAQSPDPSEFEYNEFFMSERQKNVAKHQADSPVFFNGFPLLQMTRVDR